MSEFNDNEALQLHLDEYARRLNRAISGMRTKNNRVSFQLDPKIVAQVRELSELENVSISEVASRLLTEYLTPEDSLGHWSK